MKQTGKLIKKHVVAREELSADRSALLPIVDDMRKNGGEHLPASVWMTLKQETPFSAESAAYIDATFQEDAVKERFSSLEKMLFYWLGTGQEPITEATLADYRRLLAPHDPLGLFAANVADPEIRKTLFTADLGSIMDIDYIYSFRRRAPEVTRMLEVGGGYGRLAEAMFNVFGGSLRYVLVDAVPGSLFYARRYLARACPDIRIGSYYDGDAFDLDRFDCYIVPTWHFEALNTYRYDACVNILSFQEMVQKHVDYYLDTFDRVAEEEALIYVANAHDHYFRGAFNYPRHWEKRFCQNSPRRWSEEHPIEIFIKTDHDCSAQNGAVDAMYRYWLDQRVSPEAFLAAASLKGVARPLANEVLRRVRWRARALQRRLKGSIG
jgi:hypothetical protein